MATGQVTDDMDCNPSNSGSSMAEAITEFDVVEPPLELENDEKHEDMDLGDGEENDGNSEDISDEEDGGEYVFRFQDEMDPLTFAEEEDASGLQPYQRFERMQQQHYELLAANKRQAGFSSEMPSSKRPRRQEEEEVPGASFDELMESMGYGMKRKSKKNKMRQKGRRKGTRNKVSAEVTRKLGDATLHYAFGRYDEAIHLLKEVVLVSPNLSDPYHTLALIYNSRGDKKRAINFYMIGAHLAPKDASLWKLLVSMATEEGDKNLANYCLNKAIAAAPEEFDLRLHRASLYIELGEYQKAAHSYEQISRMDPDNIDVLKKATELYVKCGQQEQAVCILENYVEGHVNDADSSVVYILVSLLMQNSAYDKALEHIEHVQQTHCSGKQIPLDVMVKAGICHVHLNHLEKAEAFFKILQPENVSTYPHLFVHIADSLMTVEQYESALKYYLMLEGDENGFLHLKIAECYVSLKDITKAIEYYLKAIEKLDDSVDARLAVVSLLLEEGREDEAISVLSPPVESESALDKITHTCCEWWRSGRIKLKLSHIYKAKGSLEAFVDVIFPMIRETLFLETIRIKVNPKKRLSRNILSQRAKVLEDQQTDTVFHGFRPLASSADLSRAARAKRQLRKKKAQKDAALAAGIEWKSDDSDDDSPQVLREPPLPDLLKDESHHYLILDLCRSLSSLQRYWDALEIITLSQKLAHNTLSAQSMEELKTLGAQIAYFIDDPARGWDCVTYIVYRHPYSFSAWNCCCKVIMRNSGETRKISPVHRKFLRHIRDKHKDCVPPILISGHMFSKINQHQEAAYEYLQAYKLMPENPFINLCVGTSMLNLVLDFRLRNKHQTILQGLGFLYNNSRLCENSQESLYNIARAYHHIGLVSLAATYYEKVLAIRVKDYPIPLLPNEYPDVTNIKKSGYCDLHREAAFNLHLIYKKSGAFDLARQVLKDHVN